jgi:hypothetical protein
LALIHLARKRLTIVGARDILSSPLNSDYDRHNDHNRHRQKCVTIVIIVTVVFDLCDGRNNPLQPPMIVSMDPPSNGHSRFLVALGRRGSLSPHTSRLSSPDLCSTTTTGNSLLRNSPAAIIAILWPLIALFLALLDSSSITRYRFA